MTDRVSDTMRAGRAQPSLRLIESSGSGEDRSDAMQMAERPADWSGSEGLDQPGASSAELITDFEDGVDAIEFMVQAFGVEELNFLRD